ncbi:PTS fructose transporter subunit EIIBC [Actinobacillus delphinicola]|nr:PTS fructose transporter subunit EIIBC [Actinobacillus delphinicola]
MKIALYYPSYLGEGRIALLNARLQPVLIAAGNTIVPIEQSDVVVLFDNHIPAKAHGKIGGILDLQSAFNDPQKAWQEIQTFSDTLNSQAKENSPPEKEKFVIAVTACPTGVAHTFMSAEAIERYAESQGWQIKVETRGQIGTNDAVTPEDIKRADLIFVAADIDVDLDKFRGKPLYKTSTGAALKHTADEFKKAWQEAKPYETAGGEAQQITKPESKKLHTGIYKDLMTGVSYMLPVVVAGGLLIAISFMFGFDAFKDPNIAGGLPKALMDIGGGAAFHLMIAVFAAYVAYSIADRPGLAVGLIGGMLATTGGAGILGGIVAGFLAGYTVKWLNKAIQLPASFASLKPILILPFLGTLIVGLLMVYLINPPVASIMESLKHWLTTLNSVNAVVLGLIIGAMMCVDMGGPVNKAAYTFSVGLLTSGVYTPMAAAMAAGMVPPIGMAIATWLARKKFEQNERDAGNAAFVLGLCFISEGALPFVAADPIRVIISAILGGATAGALSMVFGITLQAPHGGLFVIPFVSQPLLYLGVIAIGSIVTGVIYAIIRPKAMATI